MRTITVCVICVVGGFSGACTTPPLFPSAIMKDVEMNSFDFTAWKEQAIHPSTVNVVPQKVELGGEILHVIRRPQGFVILAEEQAIEQYPGYCPECVKRQRPFTFAIIFTGFLEPSMLQAGNELAVIGTTDGTDPELIDGTPQVLPHLTAECLHIWKTKEASLHSVPWEGSMGYYPPDHQTFCIETSTRSVFSTEGPLR